ncbi:MAG TPA: hypothetical protein VLM85_08365 [Polyangiaceae bacterium]|nr:hypothetical protein [Polyangiaceae bacterium]
MRVGVLRLVLVVGVSAAVARCGGVIAGGSDGGGDGSSSGSCSTSANCPSGQVCYFPISGGCAATGSCRPMVACSKGPTACTCNGTTTQACGPAGYTPTPVQHMGACGDGDVGPGPGPCGSGVACELCDVSGYAPTPVSQPATMHNACTPTEMANFATACFSTSATAQTCQAWQTAEADAGSCLGCVFTLQSAATWGPLVCTSSSCIVNTAGCVDVVLQQTAAEKSAGGPGSCGDLENASYGCEEYACGTCSSTDFSTCVQSATANECKSYEDAVASTAGPCAMLDTDAAPGAAKCFPQTDTDIPSFLNVFCGTGP